jgi:ankyrin repeat protein
MSTLSEAPFIQTAAAPETALGQIKEEYEEGSDMLTKKYENMSFDEMSRHLAESNRQISEMLSSTTSMASSLSTSDKEEEQQPEEDEENDPHKKWTALFVRTASNGDLIKLKEMLADENIRPFIDINARDSDGTPPLIYAACFGKTEIAKALIEAGAQIDAQDSCKVHSSFEFHKY